MNAKDEDEKQAFLSALYHEGFDPNDFTVKFFPDRVEVTRLSTGIAWTYPR